MGAAQLLSMLLGSSAKPETVPLLAVAEYVFPKGHASFAAKPDIPTYLVGYPKDLDDFYNLVPAPNEAYTNLFWPGDAKKLDDYLQKKRREAIEAKRKSKKKSTT